jgi:hypothetical protein
MFFKDINENAYSGIPFDWAKTSEPESCPDAIFNPLRWSVSYVRPSTSQRMDPVPKEDVIHWRKQQYSQGRFVIADTHFRIGGFLRSVPKLGNPDLSEFRKSRFFTMELDRKRSALGLPNFSILKG